MFLFKNIDYFNVLLLLFLTDHPIETVFEDEHTLIINKPSSIPIHPCGRYNLNSLILILAKEHERSNLRLVHRLDRMTSGLMIFAKDYDTANRYSAQISNREVKKVRIMDELFV